jgi:hypothetical protein
VAVTQAELELCAKADFGIVNTLPCSHFARLEIECRGGLVK